MTKGVTKVMCLVEETTDGKFTKGVAYNVVSFVNEHVLVLDDNGEMYMLYRGEYAKVSK